MASLTFCCRPGLEGRHFFLGTPTSRGNSIKNPNATGCLQGPGDTAACYQRQVPEPPSPQPGPQPPLICPHPHTSDVSEVTCVTCVSPPSVMKAVQGWGVPDSSNSGTPRGRQAKAILPLPYLQKGRPSPRGMHVSVLVFRKKVTTKVTIVSQWLTQIGFKHLSHFSVLDARTDKLLFLLWEKQAKI